MMTRRRGIRPDPLDSLDPTEQLRAPRLSSSALRGVPLLRQGVFVAAGLSRASGDQTITTGTITVVLFDTVDFDTWHADIPIADGVVAAIATDDITVPMAGLYLVHGVVNWSITSSTGVRRVAIYKNGAELIRREDVQAASLVNLPQEVNEILPLIAGDVMTLRVFHSVGSNHNIVTGNGMPKFSIVWQALQGS